VFTPKGSILELPAGATAVDFAYAIHSDIGDTCVAAKVDRRLTPLSTQLTNGQQVEIITAPGARPNPTWLSFIVTGKARSNIKHFLKQQKREESIELGRRLVEKALHTFGLTLSQVPENHLNTVAKAAKLESIHHFFEEVGIGNRTSLLAAKQIAKLFDTAEETHSADILTHPHPHPLAIKGTEGIVVTFAKCCRPIPGDPIGGYIESGQGLQVHVENCAVLEKFHHNHERYVSLHWEKKVHGDFPVDITVDILNIRGSLASLALTISEAESNIINIKAEEFDEHDFSVNMTVTVRDRPHLAKVLRKIRNNKNVLHVKRIKAQIKSSKRKMI
jgi:(p)ppGpp synthase/HD superfamily hydrolase